MKQKIKLRILKNSMRTDEEKQVKLANLMMKNIVQLGKFSYELEEKREQSLISQSSNMLTAFSVFSVVLFVAIPIIIDNTSVNVNQLLLCSMVISLFLITSLVLAVLSQWRYKYQTMTDINDFYNIVNGEHQNYQTQVQFDMQWKEQLFQIQTSKKKNNDKRSKLIIASMILFLLSILTVIISAFLLYFFSMGA